MTYAKTAESILMPFGLWARAGPRNHELDEGGPDASMKMGNFLERVASCYA